MDEFDWQKFNDRHALRRAVVDPRRRLRFCAAMAMVLFGLVFLRAAQLELSYGKAFRTEAAQPLRREKTLPGVRGRILAADGTVLACDREIHSLAVHYRYLQEPADQSWLRYTARRRLTPTERKDPRRLAAEQQRVLAERRAMIQRICRLCGVSAEQWHTRARAIQRRVEYIAETVNRRYRRRRQGEARQTDDADSYRKSLGRLVHEALQSSVAEGGPQRITVAEELDYHVMVDDVPLEVVAQIEARPRDFPGVKIVTRTRRHYPRGPLAAHVLGYLARVGPEELAAGYHPDDYVGRSGVEASYQHVLHGRRGLEVELVDRTGRLIERRQKRPPGVGRDVVLTIVPPLQQAAETLLDSAVERRRLLRPEAPPGGGAVVVMDVNTGALLALAGTPRFDPNVFMAGDHEAIDCLVHSPDKPLFNRPVQMALPPGSVFKVVSAVALLEAGQVEPHDPLLCRGYLHRPTQWRCAVFVRRGVGHGEVDLARALAVSCNVYFFQHAEQLGCRPLVGWARRFGFGQPTGVDLPAEASGRLPDPSKIEPGDACCHAATSGPIDRRGGQRRSIGPAPCGKPPGECGRREWIGRGNSRRLARPEGLRADCRTRPPHPGDHSSGSVPGGGRPGRHRPQDGVHRADAHRGQDGHGTDRRRPTGTCMVCRLCAGRRAWQSWNTAETLPRPSVRWSGTWWCA